MRYKLHNYYPIPDGEKFTNVGKALLVDNVFNLVTKARYFHKPTYDSLYETLEDMREQCEELDRILGDLGRQVDLAINLDVPYEELIERITTRRVCKGCKEGYNTVFSPTKVEGVCDKCGGEVVQRDDDKPDAVKERLDIYYANAEVVTSYYDAQGKLRNEVAGDKVGRTSKDVIADLINDLK